MADLVPVRRALLSVSDKTGLIELARDLAGRGVQLISTGGTAAALRQAGLPVTGIEDVTGFPEMLDGRVKTLHPKVHGGLLGVRDNQSHAAQMHKHDILPIDLLVVNLYPFAKTVARQGCSREEAIENIDIGGPAMIRSAAKNHEWVAVLTGPEQYDRFRHELAQMDGKTGRRLREELARAAYAHTSKYDAAIASYLGQSEEARFPHLVSLHYVKAEELRYGENPHQAAALYRQMSRTEDPGASVAFAEQLHGKELSYNNLNDGQAALSLAMTLKRVEPARHGAVIVKHTNPCGAAVAEDLFTAIDRAIAGDPLAAYGGILAVNGVMDEQAAERMRDKDVFLEVIIAPAYTAGALAMLQTRWLNVRLLEAAGEHEESGGIEFRSLPGALLMQERDTRLAGREEFVHRAGPKPSEDTLRAAAMLEAVSRHLFSNAVCLGGPDPDAPGVVRLFGAGAGQMDRVTSCRLAIEKAGERARGSVAFSDAFFPFSDGPELLIEAGVKTIVHPGGSKRDQDTFDLCEQRGVTCITTGLRHFRH